MLQSFIDKFRYNAKRASLVQSRIKVIYDFCSVLLLILKSFREFMSLSCHDAFRPSDIMLNDDRTHFQFLFAF